MSLALVRTDEVTRVTRRTHGFRHFRHSRHSRHPLPRLLRSRNALASEAAPFGGIKESGYGREGSRYGLDDYMHTKYLCHGGLA